MFSIEKTQFALNKRVRQANDVTGYLSYHSTTIIVRQSQDLNPNQVFASHFILR